MARMGSDDRQSYSSGYSPAYPPSTDRQSSSSAYRPTYTTVKLTFAEAINKVVASEMTAIELFGQLPAGLRTEIDARCQLAFKKNFLFISSAEQKMVLMALLSATSPEPGRKAVVARVVVRAVFGILVGLMLAGFLWAASRGLHLAFSWNLGSTITASMGWWISWPAGAMFLVVGIGVWRKK